jgi:hypothetical protein
MPIAALHLSGHCNGYRATVAVICNRQANAITRIATSTWGATFQKARLVYTAVVRPTLTYGAPIWFSPEGKDKTKLSLLRPLEVVQNCCLQMVSGAYRATPIQLLESETGILTLRDYLAMFQAQYQLQKTDTPVAELISSACEQIRNQLRGRRGRRRQQPTTPGVQKLEWYQRFRYISS